MPDAMALDPAWTVTPERLTREYRSATFAEAFALATRIALLAQARNHHPVLEVSWGKLVVTLTTHDAGDTVTDRDRDLAQRIDRLTS